MLERAPDLIRELMDILDIKEESDGGNMFHPTYISCCRTMTIPKLEVILKDMREIAQRVRTYEAAALELYPKSGEVIS